MVWRQQSNRLCRRATKMWDRPGARSIRLHNLSAGEDREIYHALGYTIAPGRLNSRSFSAPKTEWKKRTFFRLRSTPAKSSASIPLSDRRSFGLHRQPRRPGSLHDQEQIRRRGRGIAAMGNRDAGGRRYWSECPPGAWGWVSQDERWLIGGQHRKPQDTSHVRRRLEAAGFLGLPRGPLQSHARRQLGPLPWRRFRGKTKPVPRRDGRRPTGAIWAIFPPTPRTAPWRSARTGARS